MTAAEDVAESFLGGVTRMTPTVANSLVQITAAGAFGYPVFNVNQPTQQATRVHPVVPKYKAAGKLNSSESISVTTNEKIATGSIVRFDVMLLAVQDTEGSASYIYEGCFYAPAEDPLNIQDAIVGIDVTLVGTVVFTVSASNSGSGDITITATCNDDNSDTQNAVLRVQVSRENSWS